MISRLLNDNLDLNQLIQICQNRYQTIVTPYLHDITPADLKAAMQYTLNNGGKRLRPLLIYATGLIFDAPWENMDLPAASVELIHTYSLIHDDLPCMDDADLRRGKPTCHKVFSDGMAVLAGDALHTLALQILASHEAPLSDARRLAMIATLTKACGPFGMAAGQALDIMHHQKMDELLLENIHRLKTGKLFSACIELGRLSSSDDNEKSKQALSQFSDAIGLAFQIQDDIFDVQMSTEILGKPQGNDTKNNKMTYPQLIGMTKTKAMVESLYDLALSHLELFGDRAKILRELTQYMQARKK